MSQIYDSMRELITPRLISHASSYLGEDSGKVTLAVKSILAGLLYTILPKENSSEVEFAVRKAGRAYPDILSNLSEVFSGHADEKTYYAGSRFIDGLFDNRVNTFMSLISADSGLSIRDADKLISMVSPVVAGFLGNRILTEKISFEKLLRILQSEKDSFVHLMPARLPELIDMSTFSSTNEIQLPVNINYVHAHTEEEPKNSSPLRFFFFLLVLATVLFSLVLWWKSCQ